MSDWGAAAFKEMNKEIIDLAEGRKKKDKNNSGDPPNNSNSQTSQDNNAACEKPEERENKGKLKLDATVSEQMIKYPTDLNLIAESRKEAERLIDILYKQTDLEKKPRTYKRNAQQEYLSVAKKKKKSKKVIRKAVGKQLRYLRRDLKHIDNLLDLFEGKDFPLGKRVQRIYWVIQHIYSQQEKMYREKTQSVDNRIVNIYQPYVRPIPRGKDKTPVEFGAKLGVSEVNGFCRINNLNWEAYNECTDLKPQVEAYAKLYG